MSIVYATTTISIKRPTEPGVSDRDPWERDDPGTPGTDEGLPGAPVTIASGVRADISVNRGRSANPGDTEITEFFLVCDPTDLAHQDIVTDDTTGRDFAVSWSALPPNPPGFQHVQAGLMSVSGFGNP